MPGGDDELVEIDQVIGVQVGDEEGGDVAAGHPGGEQALRHAGSAIDEQRGLAVADQVRGSHALGRYHRASGAEQDELHGGLRGPPRSGRAGCRARYWYT
jgi:hypothetical protein